MHNTAALGVIQRNDNPVAKMPDPPVGFRSLADELGGLNSQLAAGINSLRELLGEGQPGGLAPAVTHAGVINQIGNEVQSLRRNMVDFNTLVERFITG